MPRWYLAKAGGLLVGRRRAWRRYDTKLTQRGEVIRKTTLLDDLSIDEAQNIDLLAQLSVPCPRTFPVSLMLVYTTSLPSPTTASSRQKRIGRYPVFVPKADSDGIAVAGIHMLALAVPRATYTGWNPRA